MIYLLRNQIQSIFNINLIEAHFAYKMLAQLFKSI